MQEHTAPPQHMMQLMCIMNQIHRLAMGYPGCTLPSGMTASQIAALSFLSYNSGRDVYQRDLESCFRLRRSTLSSLLSTLEKKKLLRRETVPQDARLKKLVLTEEGQKVGNAVDRVLTYANHLMIQSLSQEELDNLQTTLQKIQQSLDAADI